MNKTLANAHQMEANRLHLHTIDPDAARTLTASFDTGQHWKTSPELLQQMATYSRIKFEQGQSELYRAMFHNYRL